MRKVHLESRETPAGVLLREICRLNKTSSARYNTAEAPASVQPCNLAKYRHAVVDSHEVTLRWKLQVLLGDKQIGLTLVPETHFRPFVLEISYRIPHVLLIMTPLNINLGGTTVVIPVGFSVSCSNSCIRSLGMEVGSNCPYRMKGHFGVGV